MQSMEVDKQSDQAQDTKTHKITAYALLTLCLLMESFFWFD